MIKPILFISDLHLDPHRPEIIELFLRFLNQQATEARALYILGDFFEIWIGDDDDSLLHQQVQTALKTLTKSGIPVYLMHGNRDFLMGKQFCETTGCQLLADPAQIDLRGTPALLMHGDLLCTDDISYQRFRCFVRHPWFQYVYLNLPLSLRRWLAYRARQGSKKHTDHTAPQIMDVNQNTVIKMMREHQVNLLIHGHTHRPTIHKFLLDNKPVTRIVLGAWHDKKNIKILVYTVPEKYELISFADVRRDRQGA